VVVTAQAVSLEVEEEEMETVTVTSARRKEAVAHVVVAVESLPVLEVEVVLLVPLMEIPLRSRLIDGKRRLH
jgi:hypothetical protein